MIWYVLVLEGGTLVACEEYADPLEALARFEGLEAEGAYCTLLGSDSLDTIRETHPNWFADDRTKKDTDHC